MTDKVTTHSLQRLIQEGKKISMVTTYDYPFAYLADQSGIDIVFVGDSLGNVVLGHENTLSVTIDDMIHHSKAAAKGVQRAMLLVDMPFMSYQVSVEEALGEMPVVWLKKVPQKQLSLK